MENNNNNLMSMLLPMMMQNNSSGNDLMSTLMPMLLSRGGGGSSADMMNILAPMMEKQNPDMARILKSMNSGTASTPEITVSDNYNGLQKNKNKYIDYNKLYPQNAAKLTDNIENLSRINNQKIPPSSNYETFNNTQKTENNSQNNNYNNMLAILQMMQSLKSGGQNTAPPQRKPDLENDPFRAIERIAPSKIKKSLRAILELNSIIKDNN